MNILVIGGSYFLGPAFIRQALEKGHDLTVFNRGNRPLGIEGVRKIQGDRTKGSDLKKIEGTFDATLDLCAYEKGDIDLVKDVLSDRTGRYVFISTVDVYKRGEGKRLDESAELETRDFGGEAGAYILGKAALEREISKYGNYSVLRPSVIYGPGNYAPRENIYFKWIESAGQILEPSPSDGFFQAVYVGDVAEAALRACSDVKYLNRAFNVTDGKHITYEEFTGILKKACDKSFEVIKITPEEAFEAQVPFPFPITLTESEDYDGSAIAETGFEFTDICEGMTRAWRQYVHS